MKIISVLLLCLVIFSCVRNKNLQEAQIETPQVKTPAGSVLAKHIIEVKEVIQANSYTYILGSEKGNETWLAVTKLEASVGDIFYYEKALEMTNFESKELGRTFDVILFVSELSKDSKMINADNLSNPHEGAVKTDQQNDLNIEKMEGAITIAELFSNTEKYSGEKVKISGIVVKVNNEIMGKNWIHLQDGTKSNGKFDLTITTQATVNVDDKLTFEGVITLNKDFGAGYSYEVIMEEAVLFGNDI